MRPTDGNDGTLKPNDGTLVGPRDCGTARSVDCRTITSDLGTMVINSDGREEEEDDEDSTMKRK